MTGINSATFTWRLSAHQLFTSPESVIFYTDDGYNGLMDNTHDFVKNHIIDQKWQKEDRPIVFNSWEACEFDFDEKKLVKMAKQAKGLGMECFVLDDGWFGHRNNAHSSLGDWQVDQHKFPNGLAHFREQVHAMKMKFGLWFEPEMVSPDTVIYQEHPDWVVRHPHSPVSIGRGQYVLDFSNPEVVENIFKQMSTVISDANVDYVKWDMNRNITEAYSPYLKEKGLPQGEFFHRYISGVYQLYAKLLDQFPDLLIVGCASGGGRFDLGILYYSPQIWPSDNSDAVERLDIMSGNLLAYPLSTFCNHVSAVPNSQVRRLTSLKFRQDLCSFGPLGYELNLDDLSDLEKSGIKSQIRWYKARRGLLVNGRFGQLLPIRDQHNKYAWYVEDKDTQIVGFYRKLAKPNENLDQYLFLSHFRSDEKYLINGEYIVSGQMIHNFGLREPYQFNVANSETSQLEGDFQSYIYEIKEKA